ncbi:MAG: hypothetical protein IT306_12880 [Chloroflexi bacterium]|nr:hypothetical protein [Chloroflexota bacterium]
MSMVDPEATQLLRRAIQLGNAGRATVADLRLAVEHPIAWQLPPARLLGDAPLARLLRRAIELAQARGGDLVGRQDLLLALYEAEASQLGMNLDRLRYARAYVRRAYADVAPAARSVCEPLGVGTNEPPA